MITITKDSIYSSDFSLKRTSSDSKSVDKIDVSQIVFSLGEDVELGEDVTFERLFDMIIFHKDFFNILFSAEMGGLAIDDFINDYEQEFDLIVPNQRYILRFSWNVAIYDVDNKIEYYDYPVFEAFGKLDTTVNGEDYPISIAFSSLSQIRKKNLLIDNSFDINSYNEDVDEIYSVFKSDYKPFTLYQLIGVILHEISQYGTPDERDDIRKQIEIKSKEIEMWDIEESESYSSDLIEEWSKKADEYIHEEDDNLSYWDILYPSDKTNVNKKGGNKNEPRTEEESVSTLNKKLLEAEEAEDYEEAAKIKKIIDKKMKQ